MSEINWGSVVRIKGNRAKRTKGGITVHVWGRKVPTIGIRISEAFCREAGLKINDRVNCYVTVDRKGVMVEAEQDGDYQLTVPGGHQKPGGPNAAVFRMRATPELLEVFGFTGGNRKPYGVQCYEARRGVLRLILPQS